MSSRKTPRVAGPVLPVATHIWPREVLEKDGSKAFRFAREAGPQSVVLRYWPSASVEHCRQCDRCTAFSCRDYPGHSYCMLVVPTEQVYAIAVKGAPVQATPHPAHPILASATGRPARPRRSRF
jgi:hypothetical protein